MQVISIWIGAILAAITLISALIAGIVIVKFQIRQKVDDSWERTAYRRGEDLKDAREENEGLKARIKYLENEHETDVSQLARARAKLDKYEDLHGPLPRE